MTSENAVVRSWACHYQLDTGTATIPPRETSFDETIHWAYLIAELLVTNAEEAESAIQRAIVAWDPDQPPEEFFQLTLKSALVQPQVASQTRLAQSSALPRELRRVKRLPTALRQAYVLRFLVGLSRTECPVCWMYLRPKWISAHPPRCSFCP